MQNKNIKIVVFLFLLVLISLQVTAYDINNITHYYDFDECSGVVVNDTTADDWNMKMYQAGAFPRFNATQKVIGCSVQAETGLGYVSNNTAWVQNTSMTICLWWYDIQQKGSQTNQMIFGRDIAGGNVGEWTLRPRGADDFVYWIYSPAGQKTANSNDARTPDEWIFICVTMGGGGMKMYLNASLQADQDISTALPYNTMPINFTQSYNDNTGMLGNLDEISIWQEELSQIEITALYNGGVATYVNPFNPAIITNISLNLQNLSRIRFLQHNETSLRYIFANYTLDSLPDPNAVCNWSAKNVSYHKSILGSSNVTLSTINDDLQLIFSENNNSIKNDNIFFRVCRINLISNLDIYINGNLDNTLNGVIPRCSLGFHEENEILTNYNNQSVFNITLKCSDCNAGNKQLIILSHREFQYIDETLVYERHYYEHNESLTYNATTQLYEKNHAYRFPFTGVSASAVNVTCNDSVYNFSIDVEGINLTIDILSFNDVVYTPNMQIESTETINITIDVYGDIVDFLQFNLTYNNGTVIKTDTAEVLTVLNSDLNEDGIYNISITATDDEGISVYQTGYFQLNDTVDPSITWVDPNAGNTSEYNNGTTQQLNITLTDLNLFAYELIIRNSSNDIVYNFTAVDLGVSSFEISENIILNNTGNWSVHLEVADDHTAKFIPAWDYTQTDRSITFKNLNDVTLAYEGTYNINNVEVIKETDKYSFNYDFDYGIDTKAEEVSHKWRVYCEDPYYIPDSFDGHIVCFESKKWIDFNSYNLYDVTVKTCGSDCFEITGKSKPENINLNSVGGLNIIQQDKNFQVITPVIVPNPNAVLFSFDPTTTEGSMFLFVMVFLYLGLMVIGFYFKNFWFSSMAFFLGLIIGLMFASFHIFLTILFFLINIGFFFGIAKGKYK